MVEIIEFLELNFFFLLRFLILILVSIMMTIFLLPYLSNLLNDSGLVKPNFRGENIPAVGGLVFITVLPLIISLGYLLNINSFSSNHAVLFLIVVIGMGFAGLVDDHLGTHAVKGFKGHLKFFLKEKKLTTGAYKAFFGGVIAFLFSIANARLNGFGPHSWIFVVDFLLVGLSANTINLFDLRPGRAGKVFLLGFLLVLLFSKNFFAFTGLFIPILVILLFYLPQDLKAKVMMGDVGSNLLGASLGVMMVWMLSGFGKIIALSLLLGLQIMAEKISFSEIINRYALLKYFDNLGRD